MHLFCIFRKKEREKGREQGLQDLSKLGNLGALTGLEIVEGEEEGDEVFEDTYDKTEFEAIRRSSTTIRYSVTRNSMLKIATFLSPPKMKIIKSKFFLGTLKKKSKRILLLFLKN